MESTLLITLGCFAATYIFLQFLIRLTQSEREPPVILTGIPFISPLIGMIREKTAFHIRLRDEYKLPIYTLRAPFMRMYIVNSTELIPALQKQWRTVSFAALQTRAAHVIGLSKSAIEKMDYDLTNEHGFSLSWPKHILPAMSPGPDLDAINRRSIEIFADEMNKFRANDRPTRIGLKQWSRDLMITATTEAVWGPQNPFRDPAVASAWTTFERGFLTLSMFPLASLFYPKLVRARDICANAMIHYIRSGGHKQASGLVRKRVDHHCNLFGFGDDDMGRAELGNAFAVLGNTAPCAFWVLWQILSDPAALAAIRAELTAIVRDGDDGVSTLDLTDVKSARCPILASSLQETLRYRAVNPGPRVLLEDVQLDGGRIFLKKGSMLMIPAVVQHSDAAAWGGDAGEYDYLRFMPASTSSDGKKRKRPNRTAFRAFGGGHVLCPGRHFASTELLSMAALVVLMFDAVPVQGSWVEPTWENSPSQAGFPVIDGDVEVELTPREPERKWRVVFSGSDGAMGIVAEDMEGGGQT